MKAGLKVLLAHLASYLRKLTMGPRCVIYLVGKHKDIRLEQEGCNPWKEANTFVQVSS